MNPLMNRWRTTEPRHQRRILNGLLILTSLFGFLEWGGNNQAFLFEAELDVLSRSFTDPVAVIHPLTLLPMAGQIVLLITLFQDNPGRRLTFCGITGLGLLITLMLVIGLIGLNWKIVASTLPFLLVARLALRATKPFG